MVMMEQVQNDLKEAMKNRDQARLNALRFLKSLLLENKVSKKPIEEMDVLISYIKKLSGSLDQFPAGSEQRVATEKEIEILSFYAPKALSENEVVAMIKEILTSVSNPQFGQVMKELSPKIKGRFDGKFATDLIKKLINS